jgi:hypothetical protein
MTQLTDKIREAIIGNVGTVVSGRIGTTDAELMEIKFAPTFDAEDLTKLPNFETVASVMINNVPSAPFSMSLIPPLGQPNPQLAAALKRLSAAKYGKPRAEVEREIFARLRAGDAAREAKKKDMENRAGLPGGKPGASGASGSSFLDEWLAKRKQMQTTKPAAPKPAPAVAPVQVAPPQPSAPAPLADKPPLAATMPLEITSPTNLPAQKLSAADLDRDNQKLETELHKVMQREEVKEANKSQGDTLHVQSSNGGDSQDSLDEIFIDVRGNLHHRGEDTPPADTKKTDAA